MEKCERCGVSFENNPESRPGEGLCKDCEIKSLQKKIKDMEELHIMQLAAISTASIQNTDATVQERIPRDNIYWTQAYGDTCEAINREMSLIRSVQCYRAGVTALDKKLDDLLGGRYLTLIEYLAGQYSATLGNIPLTSFATEVQVLLYKNFPPKA